MIDNNIWFGLVEIKPLTEDTMIKDALGAFVNVLYKANSKKEFLEKVEASFYANDYKIIDINDIENGYNISMDNPDEAEKMELLKDITEEGYEFSWGVFHTFDDEKD